MSLSLSNISAGAMTAAVTLGSTLQSVGASAAATMQSLPQVIPQALPATVHAGATGSAQLATNLALVERPTKLIAAAVPRASLLVRTAGFLSKALPIVSIGAGALMGARIVNDKGAAALVTTKDGRGAVLSTVGGALLLAPVPGAQLAAAGVLAAVAVNQFGGMDGLDNAKIGAGRTSSPAQQSGGTPLPAAPPLR